VSGIAFGGLWDPVVDREQSPLVSTCSWIVFCFSFALHPSVVWSFGYGYVTALTGQHCTLDWIIDSLDMGLECIIAFGLMGLDRESDNEPDGRDG